MKMIIFSGFFYFSYWYLVSVYQGVTHLFSLTCWMETVLYSQMCFAIFQFCTQVKFDTLNGNIAYDSIQLDNIEYKCFIFWAVFRTHCSHLSLVLTRHMFLFVVFWRNWNLVVCEPVVYHMMPSFSSVTIKSQQVCDANSVKISKFV